jgi:hypothetical protein
MRDGTIIFSVGFEWMGSDWGEMGAGNAWNFTSAHATVTPMEAMAPHCI